MNNFGLYVIEFLSLCDDLFGSNQFVQIYTFSRKLESFMWSESVDNQGESIFNHHVKQCLTHLEADLLFLLNSNCRTHRVPTLQLLFPHSSAISH